VWTSASVAAKVPASHLPRWDGNSCRPTFFEAGDYLGGTDFPASDFLPIFTNLKYLKISKIHIYSAQRSAYESALHGCPAVPGHSGAHTHERRPVHKNTLDSRPLVNDLLASRTSEELRVVLNAVPGPVISEISCRHRTGQAASELTVNLACLALRRRPATTCGSAYWQRMPSS
jgi:hypothetical protein